jgi:hypothetical protein
MSVEYLRDRAGASFAVFVATGEKGERFDRAFLEHFGDSLDNVWNDFLESLDSGSGSGTPNQVNEKGTNGVGLWG